MMDMLSIATRLAQAFADSRMTFEDLSMKTGIPKSALHRYMTGETPKIPLDRFEAICKALDLDAAETLGWTFSWDHTVHEMPKFALPPEITAPTEKSIEWQPTKEPESDKGKIYEALGTLARVDMDSAVEMFKTLVEKKVL